MAEYKDLFCKRDLKFIITFLFWLCDLSIQNIFVFREIITLFLNLHIHYICHRFSYKVSHVNSFVLFQFICSYSSLLVGAEIFFLLQAVVFKDQICPKKKKISKPFSCNRRVAMEFLFFAFSSSFQASSLMQ